MFLRFFVLISWWNYSTYVEPIAPIVLCTCSRDSVWQQALAGIWPDGKRHSAFYFGRRYPDCVLDNAPFWAGLKHCQGSPCEYVNMCMRIIPEQDHMRNKTSHETVRIVYVKQKGITKGPMDPWTDKVSASPHGWRTKVFPCFQYNVLRCSKEPATFIKSNAAWWLVLSHARCWLAFFTFSQKSECKIPTKPLGRMCLPRSHTLGYHMSWKSWKKMSCQNWISCLSATSIGVGSSRLSIIYVSHCPGLWSTVCVWFIALPHGFPVLVVPWPLVHDKKKQRAGQATTVVPDSTIALSCFTLFRSV